MNFSIRMSVQIRSLSYKSIRTWYANLVPRRKYEPPYQHVVQIGDPTLRVVSEDVPKDLITSPEIKFLIKKLKNVLSHYKGVGLSATQIGMPFRIILIEFNKNHAKAFSAEEFKNKEMVFQPQTVILNPSLKITDYTKIVFPEACESIRGFYAEVPRYRAIEVTGLGEDGHSIVVKANGWLARIIQHEMDHLDGKLYIDIMNRKSFTCSCWHIINERGGKVELPYYGSK